MTDYDLAVRPGADSGSARGQVRPASPASRGGPQADQGPIWVISIVAVVAVLLSATSLGTLVQGEAWWSLAALYATLGVVVAAVLRRLRGNWLLSLSGGVLTLIILTVLLYGQGSLWLGVVPTLDTADQIAATIQQAFAQIYLDTIPATSTPGLQLMIAVGVGGLAVVVEALVVGARAPLIAGIPLLLLTIVPRRVVIDEGGLVQVGAIAALFLVLLWLDRRRDSGRATGGIAAATGAVAVIGALFLQAALPPFGEQVSSASSLLPVFGQGGDPLVRLGAHLRQGADVVTLTYETSSTEPVYLRVVTIDDLAGQDWTPSDLDESDGGTDLGDLSDPAGLSPEVARVEVSTTVDDRFDRRQWLPVPYPATSIESLDGSWVWSGDSLSVESARSTQPAGQYVVNSLVISPTPEQLQNASGDLPPGFSKYLELPAGTPEIIADTAASVTAEATTDYERAVALQAFFRDDFVYDEEAPVANGYDGDGMAVIEAFLGAQRGYCVHFASAMTAMARSLDIPARLAVGYQPGERQLGTDGFEVTSHDLHAWPELYFPGVGWTRFEPTPSRGDVPDYSFGVAESTTGPASAVPTTGVAEVPDREEAQTPEASSAAAASANALTGWLVGVGVLILLLIPAGIRAGRRRTRLGRLARGRAGPALDELADTALDLGAVDDGKVTPRSLGATLGSVLGEAPELARLVAAVERERFARPDQDSAAADIDAPDAAEIAALIARLRARATRAARLRALFLPRSLFRLSAAVIPARR